MGHLKIIFAILIWSSLGIFIRRIDLPNEGILFYSAAVAGMLQFILLFSTGILKQVDKKDLTGRNPVFLILCPLCFIANSLLFYFAFRNTTIANAVLTHYTAPVFVAIFAPLLLKEYIKGTTWLAIALSSAGLWFIMSSRSSAPVIQYEHAEYMGIAAGALSGLAYALLILVVRRIASVYPSLFITFVQNAVVTLVLLPFVLTMPVPPDTVPYLVTLGVMHSTLAPLLYVQGFRSVKANEAAILGYFEPVGATILAFVILNEIPDIQALPGGILILYSGYIVLKYRNTGTKGRGNGVIE